MHVAAGLATVDVARWLVLNHKDKKKLMAERNKAGQRPLEVAIEIDNEEMVDLLLNSGCYDNLKADELGKVRAQFKSIYKLSSLTCLLQLRYRPKAVIMDRLIKLAEISTEHLRTDVSAIPSNDT